MADYQLQSSKFHKELSFTGTGVLAPENGHKLYGEKSLGLIIENVGDTNHIQVQAKLIGQSSWRTISNVFGNTVLHRITIAGYDLIRFNIVTYSASGGTPKLISTGHFSEIGHPGIVSNIKNSAYGKVLISEPIPLISSAPTYGFIPANFRTFTSGTGTATTSENEFKVTSGTSLADYGTTRSFRALNYREGAGAIIRCAARFPDNTSTTWSGVGGFNIGDELSFGYSGTTFGIWHRYGGKPEIQTLTVTGAAGGSENATVTINSTAYTVPLTSGTVQENAYEIEDYLKTNGDGTFDANQNDDTVEITFLSDGNKTGTFSFSSSTATASFAETVTGVTKTSVHIPQSTWNGVTFPGFDPSKGNTYQILLQSGYGDIKFEIENPESGDFDVVHTLKWANNNTQPNLLNANLHVGLYATAIGTTTDVEVYAAYVSAFSTGLTNAIRNPRSFDNTKSIGTTLTNILTIRNKRNYNSRANQVEIEPLQIVLANDGTKTAIFQLRANPTVDGTTNYQNIGNNLVSEYDTTGGTVTENGRPLGTYVVAKASSLIVNLKDLEIRQPPTLRLVISGKMISGSAADLTASLIWYEDV